MAKSSRIQVPYPDFRDQNWYSSFVGMVDSIDANLFAGRDIANMALVRQGEVSISSAGVVSWPELKLYHGTRGFVGTIAAGSQALASGQGLYLKVPHPPSKSYDLLPTLFSGNVPNTSEAQVLFYRHGDYLWQLGGDVIALGTSTSAGAKGVVVGDELRQMILLSSTAFQGDGLAVLGRVRINPAADYAYAQAATQTFEFVAEANVFVDTQTAFIKLYDVTASPVELVSFDLSSDQSAKFSQSFVPAGAGERVYEVQAGMDSAGGPYGAGEELALWHASIQIVTTF